MSTDAEIRVKGMQALIAALGLVDSARFVSLALREPFDYTKWRQEQFADETLDTLFEKIQESEKKRELAEPTS